MAATQHRTKPSRDPRRNTPNRPQPASDPQRDATKAAIGEVRRLVSELEHRFAAHELLPAYASAQALNGLCGLLEAYFAGAWLPELDEPPVAGRPGLPLATGGAYL